MIKNELGEYEFDDGLRIPVATIRAAVARIYLRIDKDEVGALATAAIRDQVQRLGPSNEAGFLDLGPGSKIDSGRAIARLKKSFLKHEVVWDAIGALLDSKRVPDEIRVRIEKYRATTADDGYEDPAFERLHEFVTRMVQDLLEPLTDEELS